MKDISVIVVSYNTKETTKQCIKKISLALKKTPEIVCEIIVVDNGSTDGSYEMLEAFQKIPITIRQLADQLSIKIIKSDVNLGFAKANNLALQQAQGTYILFLNSDVYADEVNFADLLYYLNKNPNVGVLTVKVTLPSGKIDWASHRGIPTVWRSFTYFSKLEKYLGKLPKFSKFFGGYHMTHLDFNTIHEIDSPSGAFYLTRKSILDQVGGFDTRFFMYGEDLDLSHRIKKLGFKIIYYPLFTVTHLKYKSGIRKGEIKTEIKTKNHFYEAMRLFYEKHSEKKNWRIINKIVYFFISLKEKTS